MANTYPLVSLRALAPLLRPLFQCLEGGSVLLPLLQLLPGEAAARLLQYAGPLLTLDLLQLLVKGPN